MSNDAAPSQDDVEAAQTPKAHAPTLSEPKAKPGDKPSDKPAKAKKKPKPEPTTAMGKLWYNWVKPIGSVIVIVVVFRSMLLDWNDVPTGSMEPEIHVGDRIAVNRLAYGLQFPLTGPQIGIPFTPIQFDNPLDGIPQIGWGSGPQRGDIVTFWNPVTDIRMVKRIVAIPGDTIAMSGGVMTINGQTAIYTDLDPATEGLPTKTKYGDGITRTLSYKRESLLGQERIVQRINKRWITEGKIIELPNGLRYTVAQGQLTENFEPKLDLDTFIVANNIQGYRVLAEIKEASLYIDGVEVDYNTFAAKMFEAYQSGSISDQLEQIGLSIDGHRTLIEGEPVPLAFFEERLSQLSDNTRSKISSLITTLRVLSHASLNNYGPYTVPEGGYLMIGDNRNNSSDGRYFGPVMGSEITGKAFGVAFSFKDNKMFALPPDPAWGRFFKDLD